MGLDDLRARLDRLLSGLPDRRSRAAGLRDALIELKVAAGQSRDALAAAERDLALEQRQLTDAERRGRLARDIRDLETARIADEFAARHRERSGLLERKIGVIRDELAFAEREYAELAAQLKSGTMPPGGERGGDEPGDEATARELDALGRKAEREAAERAVQAQLELLKKKLGKQ